MVNWRYRLTVLCFVVKGQPKQEASAQRVVVVDVTLFLTDCICFVAPASKRIFESFEWSQRANLQAIGLRMDTVSSIALGPP